MIRREITSFQNAWQGILTALKSEPHMRFHIVAMIAVLLLAYWKNISIDQIAVLVLTVGVVITTELLNTALEKMCDHVTPEYDDDIKKVKDVAAAAVLVASIMAVVIGLIIFIPTFL